MEGGGHMMMSVDSVGGGDRFPQWSVQETRDFLMIRAELDPTFMETKRNKVLWELISTNMKARGYNRSADQCKCKWKNLVTRYKGYETMEQEAGMRQQFPFYNELQAIFTGRMQRMLWMEAEGAGSSSNQKRSQLLMHLSSDDDEEESDHVDKAANNNKKKKKKKKRKITITNNVSSHKAPSIVNDTVVINLKEILEKLMKQQMQIEMQWMKLYESKEEERRARETEWRQRMEALENEKMAFDRRCRQRQEETSLKQETRSQKRDALITLLINKLT